MNFSTPIPIIKSNMPIDYNSKIVSLGSCFAVNMAAKLDYFKFKNSCNPFGILFHPLAIENLISYAVTQKEFTQRDVFFNNEQWHSFDVHSDWSNSNKEELIVNLNEIVKLTQQELREATHVVITYGTSWVYRNLELDAIVANCHKVPQKQFSKEILSVDTTQKSIQNTIDGIRKINPNCSIVLTISPVRHLKDGFVENQRSKAHLIAAIQELLETETKGLTYFPSYEIMMDELRDYRFYDEDMVHPSAMAIDYIWGRFCQTQIAEEVSSTMDEVSAIQKGLQHRPFNPDSESHFKFKENLAKKIDKLVAEYPFMKF